ncbi:hypothetical protein SpCBS45565_g01495 [Spizellomyces sp. 'palustris']|nr:hypothetical protein SpCBS45565_g01495 [Spizellomyces sp. 'palustris']
MPEYDPQEQQLVRRLDGRLVPIVTGLYLCYVVNRSTQFHTGADIPLSLPTTPHTYILSQIGYALASVSVAAPSTLLFRKYGPARWFAGMVGGWGLVSACSAAVRDVSGWVVTRVLVGVLQAGFLPGLMVYIVSFYTREEWATRLSWIVSSATVAVSFFGIFADWGTRFDGVHGLQTWRWMCVSDGLLSIALAVVTYLLLPNYPETCTFLTPADRVLAIARSHDTDRTEGSGAHESDDEGGSPRRQSVSLQKPKPPRIRIDVGQMTEALTDLRNWLFAVGFFGVSVAGDVLVSVGSTVTATAFGMGDGDETTRHVRIVAALPHLVGGIVAFLCAWNSDRTGDRALHTTIPLLISSAGFALISIIPSSLGPLRYFIGLLPASAGLIAAFPCLLSYALDKAQGETSRAIVAALTFSFGQAFSLPLASSGSSLLDPAQPALAPGISACLVAFAAFCVLVIRWLYRREEAQMWNKGPGLRRLLNDADEGKAWDIELSHGDIFADEGKKKGKKGRRGSGGKGRDRVDSEWDLKEYAEKEAFGI